MRLASGVNDQYIYFVAKDSDGVRLTGLASFTVYRSRNGGAAASYTTPTINETDNTNMPGVYELLVDEDVTIDAGDETQEICLHITHAGMEAVTRTIELYRPKITAGETLTVSTGNANAAVQSVANNAITAAAIANAAIDAATFAADVDAEILSYLVDDATRIDASALNTASVTTIPAILVDTETTLDGKIDAIQAATDELTFTESGVVDANIQFVNDVAVGGTGAVGDEWGPA